MQFPCTPGIENRDKDDALSLAENGTPSPTVTTAVVTSYIMYLLQRVTSGAKGAVVYVTPTGRHIGGYSHHIEVSCFSTSTTHNPRNTGSFIDDMFKAVESTEQGASMNSLCHSQMWHEPLKTILSLAYGELGLHNFDGVSWSVRGIGASPFGSGVQTFGYIATFEVCGFIEQNATLDGGKYHLRQKVPAQSQGRTDLLLRPHFATTFFMICEP